MVLKRDEFVAKAASISEVTQMSKMEGRLREYLLASWNHRSSAAIKLATKAAAASTTPSAISRAIGVEMAKWPQEIKGQIKSSTKSIYMLAREAGHKKATGQIDYSLAYNAPKGGTSDVKKAAHIVPLKPSFDAKDTAAIKALTEAHMYWIGEHYDGHLSEAISAITSKVMVENGLSASRAAEELSKALKEGFKHVTLPKGFTAPAKDYFEGVAANVATNARAYGQLRSFSKLGVAKYTITNPEDSRTCPVCSIMNGKTFLVSDGEAQINRELEAKSPEDVKAIHPWLGEAALKSLGNNSKALASAGLALPSYHFKCRCAVDISEESMGFSDLE